MLTLIDVVAQLLTMDCLPAGAVLTVEDVTVVTAADTAATWCCKLEAFSGIPTPACLKANQYHLKAC